jgi:hypothetical protein
VADDAGAASDAPKRGSSEQPGRLSLAWQVILPALAALLGAGIGATATVLVTSQQIAAGDRAALREQRQAAYAEVTVSALQYLTATDTYEVAAATDLPRDLAGLKAAKQAFFSGLGATVLLGDDAVRDAAIHMQDALLDRDVDVVATRSEEGRQTSESTRAAAVSAINDFIRTARDELT